MRKPNLFIVGAPKCGTTSLARWLSTHPQIHMSPRKEPNHFNTDLNSCEMPDRNEYEKLFASAAPEHLVLGEASVRYLYSSLALTNILNYNSESRIIAMVRNPVEMAISYHSQRLAKGFENVTDFETAWKLQADRAKGFFIPLLCPDPELLQYGLVCRLGEQIERIFDLIAPERRHVIVLDDLRQNPLKEWKKVLAFLEVDDDGRTQFPVHNAAKQVRSRKLRTITRSIAYAKCAIGLSRFRLGLLKRIDAANRREQPNNPISPHLRTELTEYFREDIVLLGELLKRDLSGWLASDSAL